MESPFDTDVARRVKRAYSSLDAVSIRTGVFLRRYPLARILVLCYMVSLVHTDRFRGRWMVKVKVCHGDIGRSGGSAQYFLNLGRR